MDKEWKLGHGWAIERLNIDRLINASRYSKIQHPEIQKGCSDRAQRADLMCFSFENILFNHPGLCTDAMSGIEYEGIPDSLGNLFFDRDKQTHEVRIWFLGSAKVEEQLQAFKTAAATRAPWKALDGSEGTDIAIFRSQLLFPTTEEDYELRRSVAQQARPTLD